MPRQDNPAPLTVAASLVLIQGLVLVGWAVVGLAELSGERVGPGIGVSVFIGTYGVLLGVAAWGLDRRRGWARGPVVLTQLIQIGIAWSVRDTGLLAAVLLVSAVVVLAGVLHPASIKALTHQEE